MLTEPDGATSRLASLLGLTFGPVSAMKHRLDKNIGRRFCKNIETALGLSDGWMDNIHTAIDVPADVKSLLNRCARGSKAQRTIIDEQDAAARRALTATK